jgi:hypothetical protein
VTMVRLPTYITAAPSFEPTPSNLGPSLFFPSGGDGTSHLTHMSLTSRPNFVDGEITIDPQLRTECDGGAAGRVLVITL